MKRPEVYVVLVGDGEDKCVHCVAKGPQIAKRIQAELQESQNFEGLPYSKWYALQYRLNTFYSENNLTDEDLDSTEGELIHKYIDKKMDIDLWNKATEYYQDTDPDVVEIVKTEMYNR